jgi:hypothetical protein
MLSQLRFLPGLVLVLTLLTACDLTTPGATPTPLTAPTPTAVQAGASPLSPVPPAGQLTAGPVDAALITRVISATQAVSRYHYRYQSTGFGADYYDTDLEGDYLGASEGYTKGRVGTQQVEHVFTQGMIFRKDGERWVRQDVLELPGAEAILLINPDNMAAAFAVPNIQPLGSVRAYLAAGQDFQDSGTENTATGIAARRITFTLDAAKLNPAAPPSDSQAAVGHGTIWVEPATQRLVQFELTIPPGALPANRGSAATPTAPAQEATYQLTLSRLDDPALALPAIDLGQALTPAPATPNAALPPLVTAALDTLDRLHNVHYVQTVSNGPRTEGDYVPAQPGVWRQIHASMQPLEGTLSYLTIAQDFQDAGPVTIGTVAAEEFRFSIPWYGSDSSGKLVVPPDARSGRMPFIGEGTVAIDPTTHNIYRVVAHLYKNDLTSMPESTVTLLLTQHNAPSSAGPAPTPALIPQAVAAMDALPRYHVQIIATTDGFTGTTTDDLDVVAANSFYASTNQSSETMMINGQFYVKSEGAWRAEDGTQLSAFPGGVLPDRMDLLSALDIATFFRHELSVAWDFRAAAADPVNGVPVQAFTFKLAPYSPRADGTIEPPPDAQNRPPIGSGTVYIDPATRLIHKLVLDQAVYTLTDHYYEDDGTMQSPPAAMQLHVILTYSRHNDPSLTLPTP